MTDPDLDPHHVRAELYLRTAGRPRSAGTLACLVHDHLVARCPECQRTWRAFSPDHDAFYDRLTTGELSRSAPSGPVDSDVARVPGDRDTVVALVPDVERLRRERVRAQRDLWDLKRLPTARRAGRVRNARVRFASRAFAELLIEESRAKVRAAPQEAAHWATLVPRVVRRIAGPESPWKIALLARAAAHHANAVRIAGDLTAAARQFIELRCELEKRPVGDLAVLAEVASLEASLAFDQRFFESAKELLDRARFLYEEAGDERGATKVLTQLGMVQRARGQLQESVDTLTYVASRLDPKLDADLLLVNVNSRIGCLCDLGRPAQAGAVLDRNRHLYEESEDAHVGSFLRYLEGRIALDLGHLGAAIESFEASREGLLLLDRTYDAVLVSLDLACAYLATGNWGYLEKLASGLVRQFQARGVSRETLAALGLLARAVQARNLTREVVERLRKRITESLQPSQRS